MFSLFFAAILALAGCGAPNAAGDSASSKLILSSGYPYASASVLSNGSLLLIAAIAFLAVGLLIAVLIVKKRKNKK